ncbi:hypothetical protein Ae201684P_018949 [Aphanomyces euteiches]|nr:hypothetical protein Ae201684P_018949 [Aphanomyces euteiches]
MTSNMNAMPEAMQGEFMALLFAYCLAPQDHDLSKIASEFAAKHNMNLKPLKKTIQHTFELVSHAVQENLSPRDFIEQLSRAGMELAPAKLFASHWETHRPALLQRVHQALVMSTSFVKLTWKLGITAATNHMPEFSFSCRSTWTKESPSSRQKRLNFQSTTSTSFSPTWKLSKHTCSS